MHVIQTYLPCTELDDRIAAFKTTLKKSAADLTSAEVQFFSAPGTMVDITDDLKLERIRLAHELFLAIVYEPGKHAHVSGLITAAIGEIWPERNDIRVSEMPIESGKPAPPFWFIRGGKSD